MIGCSFQQATLCRKLYRRAICIADFDNFGTFSLDSAGTLAVGLPVAGRPKVHILGPRSPMLEVQRGSVGSAAELAGMPVTCIRCAFHTAQREPFVFDRPCDMLGR